MKYNILLIIALIITSCNNQAPKHIEIKPNWKAKDSRYIKIDIRTFTVINCDTLVNVSAQRTSHFQIMDRNNENYELKITPQDNVDFRISTSIDSINNNFNYIEYLIKVLSKAQIPYNAIISKAGEVIGILDWGMYHDNFLNRVYYLADSLNIKQEDLKQVEHYFSSNNSEQQFKSQLIKDLSDYFDIYGTIISIDTLTTEVIQIENPNNGMPMEAKMTYQILSIINDTYEIEMKIDFGNELFSDDEEYLNDFFEGKSDSIDKTKSYFENFGIYYWNSKTSWIDSSSFEVNFINDSINVQMKTSIQTYQ
jgi:hypothetical protein